MKKTLIIDNFDSFTFNLVQYFGELGGNPVIFRNDQITLEEVKKIGPTHIVISPGPGHPADPQYFGVCRELILGTKTIPLLGVCLGHQGIVSAFGGGVISAPEILHGKASEIFYEPEEALFSGLSNPFAAMRYHSLMADPENFPDNLRIIARTSDGLIMALRHKTLPLWGMQFHPESIGTPEGKQILGNFLNCK